MLNGKFMTTVAVGHFPQEPLVENRRRAREAVPSVGITRHMVRVGEGLPCCWVWHLECSPVKSIVPTFDAESGAAWQSGLGRP